MAVELKHRNTFVVCLLRTGEPHVRRRPGPPAAPANSRSAIDGRRWVPPWGACARLPCLLCSFPPPSTTAQVLAYLLYGIRGLSAHIARLAVCPQHRRRGHASRLLRMVLAELRVKRRVHTASLHVAATNGPARALYLKHGFKDDALLEVCGVTGVVRVHACMSGRAYSKAMACVDGGRAPQRQGYAVPPPIRSLLLPCP